MGEGVERERERELWGKRTLPEMKKERESVSDGSEELNEWKEKVDVLIEQVSWIRKCTM